MIPSATNHRGGSPTNSDRGTQMLHEVRFGGG